MTHDHEEAHRPAPHPYASVEFDADEAEQVQMYHARSQGDAFGAAREHMADGFGDATQEKRVGEYWVAYYLGPAQGLYEWVDSESSVAGGELLWHDPGDDNTHIAVTVRDAGDGRFIPVARVTVTLVAENGVEIGSHEHPLQWHPLLYQYGHNWKLPDGGSYSLRVRVDPPKFARHDQINGKRMWEPAEVEFNGVKGRAHPA